MDQNHRKQPSCFGSLDRVFPKSADGLRHTPEECLQCIDKTECLRAAIQGEDGRTVKEEKLDRAYASGHIGFLERWAKKKAFQQRKQSQGRGRRWLRFFKK